ncbi:hypothetical protein [Chryseobacterium sp.]|jgi:hypothetical protein|uniref:hypothetical protein n=1 Tax=Chryseobacterium sp. TaxID=1871047 RepID=UPI002850BBBE|nr:hypothetical protein [Chryseobacterium sp.]MDR3026038.1 hypothetical protein [Chryseobacterium sp.]
MEAIKVMLESNYNTLFVIEGFEKKEITEEVLHEYTKEHFKYLNPNRKIEILPNGKDFSVVINESEYRLTWSWVKSYKLRKPTIEKPNNKTKLEL